MFKKKDTVKGSKGDSLKSSNSSKQQVSNLALLVARMQKNADQVEKDVLRAEDLMLLDNENKNKELPFKHQKEVSDCLGDAEGLLKDLFLDVDRAKKLGHPQAREIDNDVLRLHERWLKDCAIHQDVYDPVNDVELVPRINWAQVLNDKQRQVNTEKYGDTLSEVEKQIAAHNILHKEIEAYNSQMSPGTTSSKEEYNDIKKQYTNLLDNSKWRRHYLSSLYDYMHGCKKELKFLGEEQDKILKQDWSDRMVDPPDVRREYENFKNNSLLSHEAEVNRLQDDGDRLIELKHPASNIVEAQRDKLRNEWQVFLNLCICQEVHLENVEEYKKYQLDADTLSESLTKLGSTLDPKALNSKTNPEILLQLQAEERAVQRSEQKLADLRKRSTSIAPLKLRRSNPNRSKAIEALCDWSTPKATLDRGDVFTLKSNSDNENWEVVSNNGVTKSFPGVCFLIPPPDTDAIDKVDLLGGELADLKKRRAALEASLKNHAPNSSKSQRAAPVSAAPENPKALQLASALNELDKDLAQAKEDVLGRLRTPLDRTDAAQDLASRLKEQEKAAAALKALDQQKAATQKELEPLLAQKANGPTLSSLPEKLNSTKNKQDSLAALSDLYTKKANASLNLESQIKKVDGIVSGLEKELCEDGVIPDKPNAIQTRLREVQDLKKDVAKAQPEVQKLSQDLEATEKLCSSLQQGYQEYCPDIGRQRTDTTRLQGRYARLSNQLEEREKLLQGAAIKNQDFQNVSQSLDSFLNNLPNNAVSPSDDLAEVNAKQVSQERVVEDIKRKGDDIDRVIDLSADLQDVLNEYEINCDTYNGTLKNAGPTDAKKPNTSALADSVQKKEKALVNRYATATAENDQLLNQLDLAKNIMGQNEEKVTMVKQQQAQLQNLQKSLDETSSLTKELEEEVSRRSHAENDLKTYKNRLMSLKSRRGVERVEEKEVLQYYRNPKMESDLEDLENKAHQEALKRTGIQSEIEVIGSKIAKLEYEVKNIEPKLVTREVTNYERDPQLDVDAAKVKDEIKKLRDEIRLHDKETAKLQTELTILEQKKPNIKQRVVQKEVVKVEQDPGMLKAVRTFENEIADESERGRSIGNEIFQTKSQINTLERLIPTLEPKIVTKEVKKVEQDPEALKEAEKLKSLLKDETKENTGLQIELSVLQKRLIQLTELKPKVEVKEVINEVFMVSPQTEEEMARLKKERKDTVKRISDLEYEIARVGAELADLKSQPPQVEWKEVTQEVVKEERTPEDIKEIQRLKDQLSLQQKTYDDTQDKIKRLTKERDEIKAEKSKVETKLLNKEVVKYVDDPLLEKEADRLRRDYREEQQKRRTTEEMVFDLQNKYIQLERQQPEEKVVVQEVLRLQKDPRQIIDHERLGKNLDKEVTSRRQMELEVQQLKTRVEEKERIIQLSDEHQKKVKVEEELKETRKRIHDLETAPPPIEECIEIEEVMKVERDPKLEKMTNGLRTDLDKENNDIIRLQRDIRQLNTRLDALKRQKSGEKTVYKEVIRVEKDQAVEAERTHLRELVLQETNARRDLEDEAKKLNDKLDRLKNQNTRNSEEETNLIRKKDTLEKEKERLERELRTLESEKLDIKTSFQQQSQLMSEKNQKTRQKSIRMETDVQRLEGDILDEKDKIHKRDNTIRELQKSLKKEDNNKESRTKETNLSTKITILDPDTGMDMSPYDAYRRGLIDRKQYLQLQELECDWEEVTTNRPDGETSVLLDRKSGKQYPIKDALKDGRVTPEQLDEYKKGRMPISEFALLVAGDKKRSSTSSASSRLSSTSTDSLIEGDFPISGIYDTHTDSCLSIRSAMKHRMIDTNTAQKLLEAQAATGGIVDINNKERYSVHKAADLGLIEASQLQRLLNAQKAYTGVEDPITRERLSIGEAVQKGWMPKDTAMRYMEAQFLTGGLVNPNRTGRVDVVEAAGSKMVDSTMVRELQEEANHPKELIDPITQEKINYKQALNRCQTDPRTGLPMLPASSKNASPTSPFPAYFSHRSSKH
ncbi:envoplakin a isoform X1 [Alosa sapidissima]|uniref:envoplakin a isoform X1 n=2 Tax=Alosa sapidissima TaxID=34773 RepID=UPI001C085FA2|nr:envoplakin a isoform X1 [Alosa sapidissima]